MDAVGIDKTGRKGGRLIFGLKCLLFFPSAHVLPIDKTCHLLDNNGKSSLDQTSQRVRLYRTRADYINRKHLNMQLRHSVIDPYARYLKNRESCPYSLGLKIFFSEQTGMKTPISYYGGKQQLALKIASFFPEHKIYCEAFIGGAAIFFAKPRSQAEIINRSRCRWQARRLERRVCQTANIGYIRVRAREQMPQHGKSKHSARRHFKDDINSEVINFYEVLQRDFPALQSKISITLHSRKLHQHAQVIYDNPDMFDRIKRAWTVWYLANVSF